MKYYVHVFTENSGDPSLCAAIRLLGYVGIQTVRRSRIYSIDGTLTRTAVERLCDELLADPISDRFTVNSRNVPPKGVAINVWYKQGVLDVVAQAVMKAAGYIGVKECRNVRSGTRFEIIPNPGAKALTRITRLSLMNELIQYYEVV